jgi:hypothetical protein
MGNKDPAVLFYTSDFLTGVADLTMEERGQYITLLCMQHQKGHLSEKAVQINVGKISDDVLKKFKKDKQGFLYQKRMDEETEKRKKHCEKQRENVMKRWNKKKEGVLPNTNDGNTTVIPLEDGNDNENININKPIKVSKKDIDIFFEELWKTYPLKKGKGKISDTQKQKLFGIGIEELSRAITRYDNEVMDKTYLQHGSTFFNSGYIDYLDSNYQEKPKSGAPSDQQKQSTAEKKKQAEQEAEELIEKERQELLKRKADPQPINYGFARKL